MDLEKCHTLSPTRGNPKELLYPHHSTNWNHFVGSMASLTIFSESTSEVNGLSHQSSDIRFRIWMLRYVEKIRIWQKQYPKHIPLTQSLLYQESMIQRSPHNSNQRLFWVLHTSSYHREQSYVQKSRSAGSKRPPNLAEGEGPLWSWLGIGSMGQETLLYFLYSVSTHSPIISNHLCIPFSAGVPANLYQQNPFIKSGMPRLLRELFVRMTQPIEGHDTAIVLWNSRVKPETPTKFNILDKSPEKSPTKKQWSDKKHQRIHLQFHPRPPIPSGRQWAKAKVCSKKTHVNSDAAHHIDAFGDSISQTVQKYQTTPMFGDSIYQK